MIWLFIGDNSFEIQREIVRRQAKFDGSVERYDGETLEINQIYELLLGVSLFSSSRMVIITDLSSNKEAFEKVAEIAGNISDDVELVLIESSPDRRTKAYKNIQKQAKLVEFKVWTERDSTKAEKWLIDEAKSNNVKLEASAARTLIDRSLIMPERGPAVIDQWRLVNDLNKLSVFGEISKKIVEDYTDERPIESVFSLFETALRGDKAKLQYLISNMEASEDAYKVFGLLASQAYQLSVLATSQLPAETTAKAIGVHPYVAQKLAPFAKKLGKPGVSQIVSVLREADEAIKSSKAEPWLIIRRALIKIATGK